MQGLNDQKLLFDIATRDSNAEVRRAAIETMTDERYLEQIARAGGELAPAALAKISDPNVLGRLAQSAQSAAVRHRAVDRIEDSRLLRCIACADPDMTVRALARTKCADENIPRIHLCDTLSKLRIAERKAQPAAEFCGTLDDICRALTCDPRFFINGSLGAEEEEGAARLPDPTQAPWTKADFQTSRTVARFVAQTRTGAAGRSGSLEPVRYYQIKVWRVGENFFHAVAEEKQFAPTSDALAWSRASSGSPDGEDGSAP